MQKINSFYVTYVSDPVTSKNKRPLSLDCDDDLSNNSEREI